jgi:3'(2'), 5'-bisphosphate nucleotidase
VNLQALVKPLVELARRAGDVICDHYGSPHAGEFEAKGDDSPLTRADMDSHAILQTGLEALADDIPVLSEESDESEIAKRFSWERYWLVDPLDGTKEFLARTGEFTVNIALIDAHKSVLGLLYVPLTHKAYVGIPGEGAWRYEFLGDGRWSSTPVVTRALQEGEAMTVLASRRHHGPKLEQCFVWLQENWGETNRVNSGSAIKFCQMVDGEGDFYPRFSPCCEWDTAAGQALLEAAGGCLVDMDGRAFRYNARGTLLNSDFYALSDPKNPFWRGLFEPSSRP